MLRDTGIEHQIEKIDEPHIDEWNVNKMLKAAKKTIAELKNPAHLPGDMRYYLGDRIALVAGEPKLLRGEVVYPVMVDGELIETGSLNKRRTRKS